MAKKTGNKTSNRTTQKTTQKKADKTTKKTSRRTAGGRREVFGFDPAGWTRAVEVDGDGSARKPSAKVSAANERRGFVFYFGRRDPQAIEKALRPHAPEWQLALWMKSESESFHASGAKGPVWVFLPPQERRPPGHEGRLDRSPYARARDQVGAVAAASMAYELDELVVDFDGASIEEERGAIVGLELGAYSYQEARGAKPRRARPRLSFVGAQSDEAERLDAVAAAEATNLARHLVNVPPAELFPGSCAEAARDFFRGTAVSVEIWEEPRLEKERMNLLRAVGRGAERGPRLAILRYRPKRGSDDRRPIAFVGKGVTFDTGGLDIKPSSGMRLMKKDMGGSAAVFALMHWAATTGFERPIDGYLALAENAVDGRAFHPSDVIESRNGLRVEIHNTDAEGRLVLADALDVAATREGDDRPTAIIDVATLTGAIKVALGADIAGLFANDDGLADAIEGAGQATGELAWRMPLFAPYKGMLKSTFADMANASDGFAGAITAALFLEPFVRGLPWAHLDVYCWRDSAGGPFSEGGGSGQPVQALIEAARRLAAGSAAELG